MKLRSEIVPPRLRTPYRILAAMAVAALGGVTFAQIRIRAHELDLPDFAPSLTAPLLPATSCSIDAVGWTADDLAIRSLCVYTIR